MLKTFFINTLRRFGYRLTKISSIKKSENSTMQSALNRLLQLGVMPLSIIDIGAAKGSWSKMALNLFPKANYLLIEPLKEQINMIPEDISNRRNISIIEGVAGQKEGEVNISITDDLDGSGIYGSGEDQRVVNVYSLDDLLYNKKGSVLLKLDTHGYEIPIFEGASKVLNKTEAIIVEVYGFHVSPYGKLFHEISCYLVDKGFRLLI